MVVLSHDIHCGRKKKQQYLKYLQGTGTSETINISTQDNHMIAFWVTSIFLKSTFITINTVRQQLYFILDGKNQFVWKEESFIFTDLTSISLLNDKYLF